MLIINIQNSQRWVRGTESEPSVAQEIYIVLISTYICIGIYVNKDIRCFF